MKRLFLFLFLLLFVPPFLLGQGLKMTNKITHFGEDKRTTTSSIYLADKKLRSESKDDEGNKRGSIFKEEEGVLYTIDHKNKRYTKITEEDIEQMEKMMARMEDLPESSKEMMGDRMKKMMSNDQKEINYEKTGNSKRISPWGSCEEWKGMDPEGNMVEKVYTTPREDMKLTQEHFDVLVGLIDFFSFMPEGMDQNYPVGTSDDGGPKGFGVLWIYYDENGDKTQKVKVTEMKEKDIPDSRFDPPSDYQVNEMNMGGGGRR